jgi:hypothetical protein
VLTDPRSTEAARDDSFELAHLRAGAHIASSAPTDVLVTLTELAAGTVQVTSRFWAQLVASQVEFLTHLFDAIAGDSPGTSNEDERAGKQGDARYVPFVSDRTQAVEPPTATRPTESDIVPIKRYDDLTVQQVATRISRLRHAEDVERVLTYETHNKRRKGVVGAAKQQLKRISDN